jgi:penicillin amidase
VSSPSATRRRPVLVPALAGLTLAAALVVGTRGAGPLPPLGPLLDPGRGAWAAAGGAELPGDAVARIPGLSAPVAVRYDRRAVPHITARNRLDAIRALGFVVARDRLLQLEVQARSAEGTLTELAGERALPLDRRTRQMGMAWGIRRRWNAMVGSQTAAEIEAFADGVNGWIEALTPATVPVEYRLLGTVPRRWEPQHTVALLLEMSRTLAWDDVEEARLRTERVVGTAAADMLHPAHSPIGMPMVPSARAPFVDTLSVAPPDPVLVARFAERTPLARHEPDDAASSGGTLGSNTWVLARARTADAAALLAGDPHLGLTLPSLWYEVHLVVPDTLDVHGVTIPGAPHVLIGWTPTMAWAMTNSASDVRDLWTEVVDDSLAPTRYRLDGAWASVGFDVTTLRDRRGRVLAVDTLRLTHRGPLRRADDGVWRSMRWTPYEPGGELDAFRALNLARTTEAAVRALRAYGAPPQNAAIADTSGDIAIVTVGRQPLRAGDGRGDRPFDGTTRATDWRGDRPLDAHPYVRRPAQGWVMNANQEQFDPVTQPSPDYFGADWPAPWRALRIAERLTAAQRWSADSMRALQTDPHSARADWLLPELLAALVPPACGSAVPPADTLGRAAQTLACWDRRYAGETPAPILFDRTMRELQRLTWDELVPDGLPEERLAPLRGWPTEALLAVLLRQPASPWWDLQATRDRQERRDEIVRQALLRAWASLATEYGDAMDEAWWWSRRRRMEIPHLLRLPGFGRVAAPVTGGAGTLSPSNAGSNHGASWRQVVQLDPSGARARVTLPGGQRGHPLSRFYADRLEGWRTGALEDVGHDTTDVLARLRLEPVP